MQADATSRVLFIEPAIDVAYDLMNKRRPAHGGLRQINGRLWAYQPRKYMPRILAPNLTERRIAAKVKRLVMKLGFSKPLLWVNDCSFAHLAVETDWPVIYDVTDDWLHSALSPRALRRTRAEDAMMLGRADELIVVSQSLMQTRGARREARLIPDGVDVEHFQRPLPRPSDLPIGPSAVYIGTLHEDRIDLDLCTDLADAIAPLPVLFVGPNALSPASTQRLRSAGCLILGPRPYDQVPAYYQHSTLIVVPHLVTPFTESLDPIKGYECLAVGTPTISTPVAGMRDLGPPIEIADRSSFVVRAEEMLRQPAALMPRETASWRQRAEEFGEVIAMARQRR